MRALGEMPRRLLVAIGGNATHLDNIRGTSGEQKAIAAATACALKGETGPHIVPGDA